MYAATGDGPTDPAKGEYGSSVIAVSMASLKVVDYYSLNDYRSLTCYDLHLGASSPAWFAHGNYHLLAAGGKGGTLYLLSPDRLGRADHQAPLQVLRLSNDERAFEENGIWGGFATWRDAQGNTWLYVPVWGPVSKDAPTFQLSRGRNADGCIIAFKVGFDARIRQPRLNAVWVSRDFNRPEPPVVANGVVFGLSTGENPLQAQGARVVSKPGHYGTRVLTDKEREETARHAILYALDARTGEVL